MTGYQSKRAAAQDKLEQPAQQLTLQEQLAGIQLATAQTDLDKANAAWGQANLVNGPYILEQPAQQLTLQEQLAAAQPDWHKSKKTAAHDNQDIVWKPLKGLGTAPDERSEWKCYMFGNTPQNNQGIVWVPIKGQEPNWFVRWMMKVCFACTWIKEKNNG